MPHRTVAICSIAGDPHARAVREALRTYPGVTCVLIDTDRLAGTDGLTWLDSDLGGSATVLSEGGAPVRIHDLAAIWWRRVEFAQHLPEGITAPAHVDLINNDVNAALLGALLTEFRGAWVNDPTAGRLAENKLVQLRAARAAGLRVPDTLVSQDPAAIRRFCTERDGQVVIKPVRGTIHAPLVTQVITAEHLASDEALRLCPAIYQAFVPGNRHIRAHIFGDTIYAVQIESDDLDWRANLGIPFRPVTLAPAVHDRLLAITRALGLRMGVVDLKLDDDGEEPVWLEINPQGQFLFAEGLSGLELTAAFARFLYDEAAGNQP